MSHNITVEGGSAVRLATAGKYCDRDIVITATGSANEPVIEPLTITENGTYTVSEGVDGYSPVTVNVASQSDTDEPYTTITVTVKRAGVAAAGVYVEVTKGTAKISGITDANGVCVLKLPYSIYTVGGSGTWSISAIKDGETIATSSSYIYSFQTYTSTLNLFYATVKINCETGATVTLAKGTSVQTATATDNSVTFTVESSGEYTATVNYNGTELTNVVTVGTTTGGTYSSNMFVTHLSLEDTSWDRISAISAGGNPENYFAVGDMKSVYLTGSAGGVTLDTTLYVYILGFNHNSEIEGNGIHFGCFKNESGVSVALVDNYYKQGGIGAIYYKQAYINNGKYYRDSYANTLKTVLLGDTGVDSLSAPPENTLMSALPSELRMVMKSMNKYAQVSASGSNMVQAMPQYLTLPGIVEVSGNTTGENYNADTTLQTYTKQYAYYENGTSLKTYKHSAPNELCDYWLRDVSATLHSSYTGSLMIVYNAQNYSVVRVELKGYDKSNAITPIFMV